MEENPSALIRLLIEEVRELRSSITTRLSEVNAEISGIKTQVAELKALETQQEKDILEFWAERWGPLKTDIADIKNRLQSLEQKDVIELERRIDVLEQEKSELREKIKNTDAQKLVERVNKLEKSDARRGGLAAGLGLLGGGGIAALIEFLTGAG